MNIMVTTNEKTCNRFAWIPFIFFSVTVKKAIKAQGKRGREKEAKKNSKNDQKTISKNALSVYVSVITLNILNAPIKRHEIAQWIKEKKRPIYMLPFRDSLQM